MKGLLRILIFCVLIALSLTMVACASEELNAEEIKTYIGEKIIPVIAGVVTSLIALFGTLKSIFKSLKELKSSKNELERVQGEIKAESKAELAMLQSKCEDIKASTADVPQLKSELEKLNKSTSVLIEQLARLSELACIGFCQSDELVRSGKGKEIASLAEQNQVVRQL